MQGTQRFATVIATTTTLMASGGQAAHAFSFATGPSMTKSETKLSSDLFALTSAASVPFSFLPTQANPRRGAEGLDQGPFSDHVVIDAVAAVDAATLYQDLSALGLKQGSTYQSYVSGLIPLASLPSLETLSSLQFARPAQSFGNVGITTSQADVSLRADVARTTFNIDGIGVTVGVLSDSFDALGGANQDMVTGDLPRPINVLQDMATGRGTDEGRAMLQLIHDVAPGADLAFHTANFGQANFANGILALADTAQADVIVDDILYFAEPMFQDGIIAQAIDQVLDQGVAYFSSAGNSDRNAYESAFRGSGIGGPFGQGQFHDFDPGVGIDPFQSITIPVGASITLSFQWDSPFFSVSGGAGSPNDLDIFLLDQTNTTILASSADNNVGGDAVEVFRFENDGSFGSDQFNLAISTFTGADPNFLKYVWFGNGITPNQFGTASGTVYGHANATGAEAVGAAFYGATPEFGITPARLESFSAAGPTPIFFDSQGHRLATPEIRQKPEIVAPDGTNTTFFIPGVDVEGDGFPNFFGTSAAAPHAAAVAALILEAAPETTPADLYDLLEETALEIPPPPNFDFTGFNFDSGYGLIQADRAIAAVVKPAKPNAIPEPGTVIGLLAVGLLGLIRRQKESAEG